MGKQPTKSSISLVIGTWSDFQLHVTFEDSFKVYFLDFLQDELLNYVKAEHKRIDEANAEAKKSSAPEKKGW